MDGHGRCGVAGGGHEFADGGALLREHGERRGAQVVESEVSAACFAAGEAEAVSESAACDWDSAAAGAKVADVAEDPCLRSVLDPLAEVFFDFRDDGFRQRFGPAAAGCLRVADDDARDVVEPGASDGYGVAFDVDVLPLQSADLSDAQASRGDGERDGEAEVFGHGVVDDPEFFWRRRRGSLALVERRYLDVEWRALDDGVSVNVRFRRGCEDLLEVDKSGPAFVVRDGTDERVRVGLDVLVADAADRHVAEGSAEDSGVAFRQAFGGFVQVAGFRAVEVPFVDVFGEGHGLLTLLLAACLLRLPDSGLDPLARGGEPCGRVVASVLREWEGGGLPHRESRPLVERLDRGRI